MDVINFNKKIKLKIIEFLRLIKTIARVEPGLKPPKKLFHDKKTSKL